MNTLYVNVSIQQESKHMKYYSINSKIDFEFRHWRDTRAKRPEDTEVTEKPEQPCSGTTLCTQKNLDNLFCNTQDKSSF